MTNLTVENSSNTTKIKKKNIASVLLLSSFIGSSICSNANINACEIEQQPIKINKICRHIKTDVHSEKYSEYHNKYMELYIQKGLEAASKMIVNMFIENHMEINLKDKYYKMYIEGLTKMVKNPIGLELIKILHAKLDKRKIRIASGPEDMFVSDTGSIFFNFKNYDAEKLIDISKNKDMVYTQDGTIQISDNTLTYAIFHETCHFLHYMENKNQFIRSEVKLYRKLCLLEKEKYTERIICSNFMITQLYSQYEDFVTIIGTKINQRGEVKFDPISEAGFRIAVNMPIRIRHEGAKKIKMIPELEKLEEKLYNAIYEITSNTQIP